MEKLCPVCDLPFRDEQDIVAVMVSKFRLIDSNTAFAIEHPTQCIEIIHYHCYDWNGQNYMPIGEIN